MSEVAPSPLGKLTVAGRTPVFCARTLGPTMPIAAVDATIIAAAAPSPGAVMEASLASDNLPRPRCCGIDRLGEYISRIRRLSIGGSCEPGCDRCPDESRARGRAAGRHQHRQSGACADRPGD